MQHTAVFWTHNPIDIQNRSDEHAHLWLRLRLWLLSWHDGHGLVQCVAVCCSVLQCVAARRHLWLLSWHDQHGSIAVCCSVWQLVLFCFVLFCFGMLWRVSARLHLLAAEWALPKCVTNMFNSLVSHVKSRGNTLQNTATHCSTLQHTATHACRVKHNVQGTSLLLVLTFCTWIQPH